MKRYIYLLAAIIAVCACGKTPQPVEPPVSEGRVTLEVYSDSRLLEMDKDGLTGKVHFKTKGGALMVDVLTNQDEWTYEVDGGDWLDVSADEYFLYLEAARNESDKSGSATIVISAGEGEKAVSVTLTVTQNHKGVPEISLADNDLRVKAYTGLVNEIEVDTNQDEWDFDCTCSWLLIQKKDGKLLLSADPNETYLQRVAHIQVIAGDDSDWLTVSQDGTAFVKLSTQNLATDDEGDTKSLTVSSNPELEWIFASDGSSWFDVSSEGNELIVTIKPNPGGNERLGSLTVTVGDEDNNAVAKVNVRQIGPDTEELIYEVLTSEPDFLLTGAPVLSLSTGGSVTVDWGDGTPKETFESRRPTHVYKEPGLYTIEMTGQAKSLEFSDGNSICPELQNVISWGKMGYTTLVDMCLGCSNLKSIPNDVAGSFSSVKSFLGAFSCCESLEEIPSGLFRYASVAKNFEDCFSHSASISVIPEDLFANCPAAEDFSYTFYGTGSGYIITTSTLSNFEEVKGLASAGKLTEIPGGLFSNCPAVKQMDYVFGATAISSIPENIFAAQSAATVFTGAFSACVNLKSIPVSLMKNATAATDIKYMFAGCESVTEIPSGIFKGNSAVTNLEYIFYKTGVKRLQKGIFEGLSGVKTIGAVFQGCESLSEIEPGVFDGLTSAKSFRYCFADCSSLRQIPSGLFGGLTNAYEFVYTFENSALESIPEDLFADARDYSSADFTYMLANCKNLKTVPAGLFRTFTKVTSPGFKNMFNGSGIETIPAGLFENNKSVSSGFEELFSNCASLKTIEGPIFPETTSVTSLAYAFEKCTALEELPEGLFDALAGCKIKFTATFVSCTSLKSLPAGLFAKNTLATGFQGTFCGCTSLESIPADLMPAAEKVSSVKDMFAECSSLKTLPSGLFAGLPAITSFEATFADCTSLESVPEDLFSAIGTKTSSITFAECFNNCKSLKSLPAGLFDTVRRINYIDNCFDGCTSLSGESPYTLIGDQKIHIYERVKGDDFPIVPSSTSAHSKCFAGCENLDDYSAIPTDWK